MSWIPVVAWCAAVVLAIVVLGFCGYELSWKSRRLRADLVRLHQLGTAAAAIRADLAVAQQRARDARIGSS